MWKLFFLLDYFGDIKLEWAEQVFLIEYLNDCLFYWEWNDEGDVLIFPNRFCYFSVFTDSSAQNFLSDWDFDMQFHISKGPSFAFGF